VYLYYMEQIPEIAKQDSNLSKRAMLAALNIGVWSASKHDKRVSDEVAARHGASINAGKYRKRLLPQEQTPLEKVKQAASIAREFHYKNTLPWSQDGSRILPKDNYFNYVESMRKFRNEFEKTSKDFLADYVKLVEEARAMLGDLYQPSDYPGVAEIESKFSFDNVFLPFPDEKDFRIDISEDEVKEIKRTLKQKSGEAVADAMRDCWGRLYEAVNNAVERLSDPDAIFRDSLIGNLGDLCDVLPRLNIQEDKYLDQMCGEIKAKLACQSPKTLRENKDTRKAVATEAEGILGMMSSYMGIAPASGEATPPAEETEQEMAL
jgi:hypothetical protein